MSTKIGGGAGIQLLAQYDSVWLSKAICEPFGIQDSIVGTPVPPTDRTDFRFIKLTAADAYNTGVLTSEAVSGSAPLITATGVISLAGSPINGQTIHLLNTEGRFLRASVTSGTLQDSDNLAHSHFLRDTTGYFVNGGAASSSFGVIGSGFATDIAGIPTAVVGGTEARPRNIGLTYYMRIL